MSERKPISLTVPSSSRDGIRALANVLDAIGDLDPALASQILEYAKQETWLRMNKALVQPNLESNLTNGVEAVATMTVTEERPDDSRTVLPCEPPVISTAGLHIGEAALEKPKRKKD